MIGPQEALEIVLERARALPVGSESLALQHALGRVLAEPIHADRDDPPFDRAMMDGFAVSAADQGQEVEVRAEVKAGQDSDVRVVPGQAVQIMTGAACPKGTETVVPIEEIERQGKGIRLPAKLEQGKHVAKRGSSCAEQSIVLSSGDTITPFSLAVLASCGRTEVKVRKQVEVRIATTGDEIVPVSATPLPHQIRNSNGPVLQALLEAAGARVLSHQHLVDDLDAVVEFADWATTQAGTNIVVFTGGVSAGCYDFLPPALQKLGAEIVFHRVKQKPGKPILFALREGRMIFGLPGNPLSCALGFHRYIVPAMREMIGLSSLPQAQQARLVRELSNSGKRAWYLPVEIRVGEGGELEALPCTGAGSADIFAATKANAYVCVEPQARLAIGDRVGFEWMQGCA